MPASRSLCPWGSRGTECQDWATLIRCCEVWWLIPCTRAYAYAATVLWVISLNRNDRRYGYFIGRLGEQFCLFLILKYFVVPCFLQMSFICEEQGFLSLRAVCFASQWAGIGTRWFYLWFASLLLWSFRLRFVGGRGWFYYLSYLGDFLFLS